MDPVLTLKDCVSADPATIGGKAAGLAALLSFGHAVPDGFVVTTAAYSTAVRAVGLDRRLREGMTEAGSADANRLVSERIRELLVTAEFPPEVLSAIGDAYDALGAGEPVPVAIRSSATAEDLASASFAGQQDTYLWVEGRENVVRHVVRCWASLFNAHAIAYRARLDVDLDGLAMAVVVQRMVDARSAGVMMTLDPVTGDSSTVYIESAYGLGEGVVRGDVGVDRFWVAKAGGSVRAEIDRKTEAHRRDPGDGRVRLMPVPDHDRALPSLTDAEVTNLAALGRDIEASFGRPMDIEWAVAGPDGERALYLLQARPETVWSQRPAEAQPAAATAWPEPQAIPVEDWDPLHNESDPALHWSVDNIGEGLPGLLTPLGWTLWRESVDQAGRAAAHAVGVLARREHTRPADNRLMVQAFYGRAGMQLEFYGRIGDRMPGTTGADLVAGILGRVPDDMVFHPTRRRYPFIAVRLPWTLLTASRGARALAADTDRWWRAELERIPHLDLDATIEAFKEAQRRFAANQVMQGVVVFGVVGPLFQGLAQLVEAAGVGDIAVLSGSGGAEMAIISDIWRASRGEITVDDLVRNHGFHGPLEGEISSRVWREDPTPLVQSVREYTGRSEADNPITRQQEALRRLPEAQAEVLAALPKAKRAGARLLLRMAASGIPMRGVSKRAFLQGIDVARCTARQAGRLLAERGNLADPEDVFYLTTDELTGALPSDVADLVRRRRERRDRYAGLEIPMAWKGTPVPVRASERRESADVVNGLGVSPGVVEGTVRVVVDPTFADVRPDEVLVAPTTDPSWSSIMFISSALVVDIGGALSHAAVVARELGYPCIVNTRTGTKDLHTGDRVRVDGSTGTVEVLERAAGAAR